MKELTIEQKAQRYDEIVKKLRDFYRDYDTVSCLIDVKEELANIIPELKESGDWIPKEIIKYLKEKGGFRSCWITWLEKQGKSNRGISEATKQKLEDVLNKALEKETQESWNEFLDEQGEQKSNLCDGCVNRKGCINCENGELRETEQKPADKFEIGDLITNGILVGKIDRIYEWGYHVYFGDYYSDVPDVGNWHKWTIQDAKDGDVLAAHECLVLFKEIDGLNIKCYCTYHFMNTPSFYVNTLQNKSAFHPATKEQRDTLEKAMADAGYTFDFEKKEFKKIEQKFNIGDEIKTANEEPLTITKIDKKGYWSEDLFICGFDDAAKWELVRQKPAEWSEEDENRFTNLISLVKCSKENDATKEGFIKFINKLKSLRPQKQWKPSDKLIRVIEAIINNRLFQRRHLDSLYADLKKLKE